MEVSVGILQSTGIETDSAFSGGEAIKKFKASEPGYYDIIFMDIQMPDMNGYEATKIIRALGREDAQSVPILAMTADAFTQDVAKAVSAGMNDHVAKPIDPNKLFMTMKRYL